MKRRVVMGIVDGPVFAEAAMRRLVAAGFAQADVSVLHSDPRGSHDFGFAASSKAPEGALIGLGFGSIVGALVGLGAGVVGAVPTLAALGTVGPVLTALAGAALGGIVLGPVGAAVGLRVPEIEAKYYEGKTSARTSLVAVHARGKEEVARATSVLASVAASNVHASDEAAIPLTLQG